MAYIAIQGPFAKTITAFLPLDDPLTWISYGVSIWTLVAFALAMLVHIICTPNIVVREAASEKAEPFSLTTPQIYFVCVRRCSIVER